LHFTLVARRFCDALCGPLSDMMTQPIYMYILGSKDMTRVASWH